MTGSQIKALNEKYFKGTKYDIVFTVNNLVLREVSTSGLDSGKPTVTLKLSTGMVDTVDGKEINNWNNFKIVIMGNGVSMTIDNTEEDPISKIVTYDPVDNMTEPIFRTILPSLIIDFTGDRVAIESFTNRSSEVAIRSAIDFDGLFEPDSKKKSSIIEEPEEGEEPEESNESPNEEGEEPEEIGNLQNK